MTTRSRLHRLAGPALAPIRRSAVGQRVLFHYRAHSDRQFATVLRHGSRQERFTYMYETHKWDDGGESRSGAGSSAVATRDLRAQLVDLVEELDVASVFDAGCGDFAWMRTVRLPGTYIGG